MENAQDLKAIKNAVSAALIGLPGVAGVGLPARGLTIYLEHDTPQLREQIAQALAGLKLPAELHWEVTGRLGRF